MQPVPLTLNHLPLCDQAVLVVYLIAVAFGLFGWWLKGKPEKWFVIGLFVGLSVAVFGLILPKL